MKTLCYINSKHRVSGEISNFIISFADMQISKQENENLFVSVVDVILPNSHYNIDTHNNSFLVNNITKSVTPGNYNMSQLINTINVLISANNLVAAFNSITGLIKFTHSDSGNTTTIDFNTSNSINQILGFAKQATVFVGVSEHTGVTLANVGTDLCLYLHSDITNPNLMSDSVAKEHLASSTILCKIPVLVQNYSNIYFHSSGNENYRQQLPDKMLDTMLFRITNQDYRQIQLKQNYCFTLCFETQSKIKMNHDNNIKQSLEELVKISRMQFLKEN